MSVLKRVLGFGKPNLQHWCFRSSDHLPCGASQHDIDQGSLAMGYLTKQSAPEQLVNAIRKVHDGQRYLTDDAAEAMALRIARGSDGQSSLDSLSMRKMQVLRRLAMGQTNREIARAYHISIKTVDTYRARLLKKLGLRNNAELSRFAMQNQLIEP